MSLCYYRGKFMPTEECSLPVTDLLIQRGIGVFDSIRTYGERPFAMPQHIERLAGSARRCGIEADHIIETLPDVIRQGLKHSLAPKGDKVIKPYITGGTVNNRGHFPKPDFFVLFEEVHSLTEDEISNGVSLKPVYMERPYPEAKSTNYLFGYIPMSDAKASDFEALYIVNGEITESATSSFFLCKDGRVITAPVGRVLRGITREILLTLLRENGFTVEERCPLEKELADADEAFISGSVKEVLPIVRVGEQVIGRGTPGPATARIRHLFLSNIHRWLED